ncbi:MAG: TRAP transporter large permease [Pseudomonadota bacterium]
MVGAAFVVLLLLGVPIAFVLAGTALFYIVWSDQTLLLQSFAQQMFSGIESYGLLAIPLFMLTGELMNEGGITKRLVSFASVFMGRTRGGLAYINLIVNTLVASIMGSAAAQMAVMARAMVPAMEREGYPKPFAAATTAAGSLLSPIIPPSMLFVIYGVLAQIAIGDLFIAGIVPGLMMAAAFLATLALIGTLRELPMGSSLSLRERLIALRNGLPTLMIPFVIVGGIVAGVATPTESAAVASVAAALLGFAVYRELDWRRLPAILMRTGLNASIVIFIVAAANLFGWVIVYEQVPQALAAQLSALTDSPLMFLLIVNLALILVGMVIDGIAALILIVPILLPIAINQYGIDPYQFGVIVCINLVLGLLTPPVGAGLFVMTAMTGVRPGAIVRALAPFLIATVLVLLCLSVFPGLVTVLIR